MAKYKQKDKKAIFILQITETNLKAIKCLIKNNFIREFQELKALALPLNLDDKGLIAKVKQLLLELGYTNNNVILSLPRQQATCRYIKIPAQSFREIEKIISFQAAKYLPYPVNELLTGYQVILSHKEGYSHINLNIVHKKALERYLGILSAAGVKNTYVTLSSYGLANLYSQFNPQDLQTTLIVDIDVNQVEFAIVLKDKLYFSRSFRIMQRNNLELLLREEITKTNSAYLKETGASPLSQIVILNSKEDVRSIIKSLSSHLNLPAQVFSYEQKLSCFKDFRQQLLNSEISFANLIGLGLKPLADSVDIVPMQIKEARKKISLRRRYLRFFLWGLATIIIFALAIAKSLDNKIKYLNYLKKELNKISGEAKGLEELEKRINMLQSHGQKKPSLLDILHQLHQIIPENIFLANLLCEEDSKITLKGQAPELNAVLSLVSQLERSSIFNNFNVKVEYATKRKSQSGEFVDFQIICLKETRINANREDANKRE
jgi:Tfp pilus assembly protein PilN